MSSQASTRHQETPSAGRPFDSLQPLESLPPQRRGFSVIDLLFVSLIVAVLVSLLLPAVQAAREAARRTQCKQNLAQLSLALHSYQHSFTVLPPGVVNDNGPIKNIEQGYHISWLVQLLPYIGETAAYDHVDFSQGAYSPQHQKLRQKTFSILRCPSEYINPDSHPPYATTSYAGCTGGEDRPINTDNTGLFFLNSSVGFEEIRDGTSHTMMLGERLMADNPVGPANNTAVDLDGCRGRLRRFETRAWRSISSTNGRTNSGMDSDRMKRKWRWPKRPDWNWPPPGLVVFIRAD